ncbi:DUF721 domain-containing protein [Candidatus Margulisiibacteriota bacterium]
MRELKKLKDIYKSHSFKGLKQLMDGANLVLRWDQIVDDTIAKETRALKYQNGVIFVEVSCSVWANELIFLKRKLIDNLNRNLEKPIVRDVKFLVKGVKYGKREEFNQPV